MSTVVEVAVAVAVATGVPLWQKLAADQRRQLPVNQRGPVAQVGTWVRGASWQLRCVVAPCHQNNHRSDRTLSVHLPTSHADGAPR